MAAILPQVGRDAMRARRLTVERGGNRVWLAVPASAVASLAQRCHVIDVYTQL
jgi:hypothetical protein